MPRIPRGERTKSTRKRTKKPIIEKDHEFKQKKEITLENHFKQSKDISSRNTAILKALDDGYTQGEVARFLDLSTALGSKIFRSIR